LKKRNVIDRILTATCIVVWCVVLLLVLLVLATLRALGKLRVSLGYLRFRLKRVERRVLWRPGQDGLRPGQKAAAFQLPRFVRARKPPRNKQGKSPWRE
jgi:hypothetical protein